MNDQIKTMIGLLLDCPENNSNGVDRSHIDPMLKPRLKDLLNLSGEELEVAMKVILDDAAHFALATDFGMTLMDVLLKQIKAGEIGG